MYGFKILLTHTGLAQTSLILSDLGFTGDGERKFRPPAPRYIPLGGSVELVYDTQVAISYATGTIRGFIDGGHATAQLIAEDDMQEAIGTRITSIVRVSPNPVQGDYTTVKAACDAETTPGTLILIMPGAYPEDPFTVSAEVHLDCWGIDVATILAKVGFPNTDLITLGNRASVRKVNIVSPSNAFGVVVDGGAITGLVEAVAFVGGYGCARGINGGGVYLRHGLMGGAVSYGLRAEVGSFAGYHGTVVRTSIRSLEAIGAGSAVVFSSIAIESAGTCFYVEGGGLLQGQGAYVNQLSTSLIHTGIGGGTIDVGGVSRVHDNPTALDILQDDASGNVVLRGVTLDANRISAVDFTLISGYGNRSGAGIDPALTVWSALHVGTPGVGRELVAGQGDVTTLGVRAFTYDGADFVDVTTAAKTEGSTLTVFPNTNANTALYVGWQLDGGFRFYGLEFDAISQAMVLGAGSVVSEYWNGTSWTLFNFMITEEEAPFLPQAMDVFQNAGGSEHLRFAPSMASPWTANDPIVPAVGQNLFWVRFRITVGITTSPIIDLIKMVPTRTRFDEGGLREMDGVARVTKQLPWSLDQFGKVAGFGTAPSDVDVWVSQNIAIGLLENSFRATFDSRVTRFGSLPADIDTSAPILIDWKWVPSTAAAGDVEWTIHWTYLSAGSVYSFADPGIDHANEQTDSVVTATPGVTGEVVVSQLVLDISGARARAIASGDILYITVSRIAGAGADTYAADAVVVDFQASYLSYTDGVQA